MKKKDKDKNKAARPPEFAVAPFRALKGLKTLPVSAEQKKGGDASLPAQPDVELTSVGDAELFLRAMGGVKRIMPPLRDERKAKAQPPFSPRRQPDEEDRQQFLDAVGGMHLDVTFREEEELGAPTPKALAANRMRRLKRGEIRLDLELDLHGMHRVEALASLAAFIAGAQARGQAAVLVITGRGNNSPGEPVLRGAVAGWLRDQGKGLVVEFAPAPRGLGGDGALVVFLREKGTSNQGME